METTGRGMSRAWWTWRRCSRGCATRQISSIWWKTSSSSTTPPGETKKILARNHQFLGVNRAIEAVRERTRSERQAGRVLAHPRGGQELLDGFVHPKGPPQAGRKFHLSGADRPRRSGHADLQDLCGMRRRGQRPRPLPGIQRRAPEAGFWPCRRRTSSP